MSFDLSAVYGKTGKGAMAVTSKSKALPSDLMRILSLVDGKSSVEEILDSNKKLSDSDLSNALIKLANDGYVKLLQSGASTIFVLGSKGPSTILVAEADVEEFFAAQQKMEAISAAKATVTNRRKDDHKTHESAPPHASNEAAEHLRREAQAAAATNLRGKIEAEHKARREAEAIAKADAEKKALAKAEAEARMDAQRKVEEEAQAKEIAETIAKKEAARKAREEAEAKEKAEEEARKEAERKAREKAEAIAKAEAEERALQKAKEKARVETETRARIEADRIAREEAEALAKAEARQRERREAEEKAKAKAEEAARKEAERKAREDAEAIAKAEAEERKRNEAEEKAKAKAEEAARKEAERKAREEAEALARAEADERKRIEAEEQAKAKAEEAARKEAERKAREDAEAIAKAEADERKRIEAEEQAKAKAEEAARKEAERKAREEAEAIAKAEADERKRIAAEEKARAEAEARAKAEEQAQAKMESARKAREEAEAKAIAEAEKRAQREAEKRAQAEARAQEKAAEKARKAFEKEERARAKGEAGTPPMVAAWMQKYAAILQPKIKTRKAPKPFKLSRTAQISLALLVLIPLVLLQVMSLNVFAPAIAKMATDRIHEPVMISSVRASLWPAPHLRLEGVSIGNLQDVKIATVRVMPALMHLFSETKILKSIEVESLAIDQDALPRVPGWIGSGGSMEKIMVEKIHLKDAKLNLRGMQLPLLNIDVDLAADSTFQHAHINSADNAIEVDVIPKGETFDIKIAAKNWQTPLASKVTFEDLTAKATATRAGMAISDIDGHLYGGTIQGNATVKWDQRWNATGDFQLARVDLSTATPALTDNLALSGRLDAKATYVMDANNLAGLFDTPRIKATFSGHDGAIGNLDLSAATMRRKPEEVKGGQTKFSRLTGNMTLAGNHYQLRQVKLESDVLKANGEMDIQPDNALSGRVNVEMDLKSSVYRSRLSLGGNLRQPSMRR